MRPVQRGLRTGGIGSLPFRAAGSGAGTPTGRSADQQSARIFQVPAGCRARTIRYLPRSSRRLPMTTGTSILQRPRSSAISPSRSERREAANGRNAGADESRVGGVEFEQIIDVPGVAGLRPVLDNLAGTRFGAAAGRSARRTGSTPARSGRLGLGRGRAGCRPMTGDLAGNKMMIVVVKVMLGTTRLRLSSGIAGDGLVGNSAPHTKASAHRQRTSTS